MVITKTIKAIVVRTAPTGVDIILERILDRNGPTHLPARRPPSVRTKRMIVIIFLKRNMAFSFVKKMS